jgi:SSS family solute:Na+ symporter
MINPWYGLIAVVLYFIILIGMSQFRSRNATLGDYLIGGRNSTWWLITLGMISDTLSGITYVSVPGAVATSQYSYLQIIFGHFFGWMAVVYILLPIYYKMNLISIYSYLGERFGWITQKTGAFFFVASRIFGSAARLYIATLVLHQFFFSQVQLSPIFSFFVVMTLIVLYTIKGGIKSLVWTDAFQSMFLVGGIMAVYFVLWGATSNPLEVVTRPQIFMWDILPGNFFFKQFIGGFFITFAMCGLDQNIMQKNISCKNLKEAQLNLMSFTVVMLIVNVVFVSLGALALEYYASHQLAAVASDQMLPNLVFNHLGAIPAIFFILGLTAATFSSADSVLPSIASSIELDLLPKRLQEKLPVRTLHLMVAAILFLLITVFYLANTQSLIMVVLKYSGYTYGPLLGLFLMGIFTKWNFHEKRVPIIAVMSIAITAILDQYSSEWFGGYKIGVELLMVNGLIFSALMCAAGLQKSNSTSP